jgi:hypothetical protein
MNLFLIDVVKILINTFVRLLPVGLYSGSAMSAVVFSDFRAILLFIGFLGNELISLGYRLILRGTTNPQCALLYSADNDPFVLPSPLTQTIGFFAGFFYMDMYFNNQFNPIKFFSLIGLQLITIYSRVNIGCKTLIDAIYCSLVGMLIGIVYYNIIKDYYKADYLNQKLTTANDTINKFFTLN